MLLLSQRDVGFNRWDRGVHQLPAVVSTGKDFAMPQFSDACGFEDNLQGKLSGIQVPEAGSEFKPVRKLRKLGLITAAPFKEITHESSSEIIINQS